MRICWNLVPHRISDSVIVVFRELHPSSQQELTVPLGGDSPEDSESREYHVGVCYGRLTPLPEVTPVQMAAEPNHVLDTSVR